MKRSVFLPLMFLTAFSLFGQLGLREKLRSFNDLFPGLDPEKREQVFSGILTESRERDINPRLLPSDAIA
ncbi:MAG: hypothetical protein LBN21_00750, partial [Treponema sp.]|nr:hypothetical protein [Treponema sp.]